MSSRKQQKYLVYIVYDPDVTGQGEDGFPGTITLFRTKESAKKYKRGYKYEVLHNDQQEIYPQYCYRIISCHRYQFQHASSAQLALYTNRLFDCCI